jgi:hypothetical protein
MPAMIHAIALPGREHLKTMLFYSRRRFYHQFLINLLNLRHVIQQVSVVDKGWVELTLPVTLCHCYIQIYDLAASDIPSRPGF